MHEKPIVQSPVPRLISRRKVFARMMRNIALGVILILFALMGGMWGYHHYDKMSWVDAFVNASMILSGMGPVSTLNTDGGKIFAGCYALFSGLFFIFIIGLVFAPLVHRFFQKMNLADEMVRSKK